MADYDKNDVKTRMHKSVEQLKQQFGGLRTGRASAGMLEPVQVEAYGARVPLAQVAGIAVASAQLLTVTVWDASLVKVVEKALVDSDLGMAPQTEGTLIRLRVPELSEERRLELGKIAGKYAEQARIAVRNIRRDALSAVKAMQSEGVSEDEIRRLSSEIQTLTDESIKEVDASLKAKEQDMMQV